MGKKQLNVVKIVVTYTREKEKKKKTPVEHSWDHCNLHQTETKN